MKFEIIPSALSNHNGMKPEINKTKYVEIKQDTSDEMACQ